MWFLYIVSTVLFFIPMFAILVYAALMYLVIAAPLRTLSKVFQKAERRKDEKDRYRGWGWKVAKYARNIALSISDQGIATFLGQSPDISISEALGLAVIMHERGTARSTKFVLWFGRFVDWLFWNKLWKIEKNHIRNSIDQGESWKDTISHWHFSDEETQSREV